MEFLISSKHFNPHDTFTCGQVFRYGTNQGRYYVFSMDKYAEVFQSGDDFIVETSDVEYFKNYFDCQTDYQQIKDRLNKNLVLSYATEYGSGIRILRQSLIETIFSFIISANNNIKRIQGIIEKLCIRLGSKTPYGYAFPTLLQLANADKQFYTEIGCGYRAGYIQQTAIELLNYDINKLYTMSTKDSKKALMNFKGIGPKVADCILLFGLNRSDSFPTDTWIRKVYHIYFEAGHKDSEISGYLLELFGSDSGYAQQYLFNYLRQKTTK